MNRPSPEEMIRAAYGGETPHDIRQLIQEHAADPRQAQALYDQFVATFLKDGGQLERGDLLLVSTLFTATLLQTLEATVHESCTDTCPVAERKRMARRVLGALTDPRADLCIFSSLAAAAKAMASLAKAALREARSGGSNG